MMFGLAIVVFASTWIEKLGLDNFTKEELVNPYVAAALIGAAVFSFLHLWKGQRGPVAAITGVAAFGWTVAATLLAKPQVRALDDFWCWIPIAIAAVATLRIVEQFPISSAVRWLLRSAVVGLFATLLAPKGTGWEDWSASYAWWIFGMTQGTLMIWATLEYLAEKYNDRFLLWFLVPVLGVAALVTGQTFASLKDICVIGSTALGVAAVAQSIRPNKDYCRSVAAGFSILLCGTIASCDFYDTYGMPLACFLLVMLAPVGLLAGEFLKHRLGRIGLQALGVITPLGIAIWQLMSFVDSLDNW